MKTNILFPLLPLLASSQITRSNPANNRSSVLINNKTVNNHQGLNQTSSSVYESGVIENSTLKVINCGAGFTGTHTVSEILAELGFLPSLHYRKQFLDKNLTYIFNENSSALNYEIRYCAISNHSEEKCLIQNALRNISSYLQTIASNFAAVGDIPMLLLGSEIVARVPDIKVLLPKRPKNEWARKRLKQNANDIICRKKFWDDTFVRHPFDITRCLLLMPDNDFVVGALTTINKISKEYGASVLAEAYHRTNKVFEKMVKPENSLIFKISKFSSEQDFYQTVKRNITFFLHR